MILSFRNFGSKKLQSCSTFKNKEMIVLYWALTDMAHGLDGYSQDKD